MAAHLKLHSFTGTSDHDFTGLVSEQLIKFDGTNVVSGTDVSELGATTLSGGTIYSGSTDLYNIFAVAGADLTTASNGLTKTGNNITLGGALTAATSIDAAGNSFDIQNADAMILQGFDQVEINAGQDVVLSGNVNTQIYGNLGINLNNNTEVTGTLDVSSDLSTGGDFSGGTGGGVIYSAGTDLYNIFLTAAPASDITRVQPGTNTTTGGTDNLPTVNLVDSPSINNLTFSGTATGGNIDAVGLSGDTIASGSTNLYDIFLTGNGLGVTGSGTANTIAMWNGANSLTDSIMTYDGTSAITVTGDVLISGNVEVLGTATTIQTQDLFVADNTITLNSGGTSTSATGGGIFIEDGVNNGNDASWTIDAIGNWTTSQGIISTAVTINNGNLNVTGGGVIQSGGTDLYSIFGAGGNETLSQTLALGNTTSDGQTIDSENGEGRINLRAFGTDNNILISSDKSLGGGLNDASLYLQPSYGGLYFSDSAATDYNYFEAADTYALITGQRNGKNNTIAINAGTGSTVDEDSIQLNSQTGSITLSAATDIKLIKTSTGTTEARLRLEDLFGEKLAMLQSIDGLSGATFQASVNNNLIISFSKGFTEVQSINFNGNAMTVSDSAQDKGLVYAGNYHPAYTDRSLVDKEYVDNAITSGDTSDITRVQPGTNITTGGTGNLPVVNLADDIILNSISATTLSGGTIYSGSTDLYDIFATTVSTFADFVPLTGTSTNISGAIELDDDIAIQWNSGAESITYESAGGVISINAATGTDFETGAILSAGTDLYSIFLTSVAGDATTASNGLTESGDNITLGGALTGDTFIDNAGFLLRSNTYSATTMSAQTIHVANLTGFSPINVWDNLELQDDVVMQAENGGGQIDLRYSATDGDILLSTDNGAWSKGALYLSASGGSLGEYLSLDLGGNSAGFTADEIGSSEYYSAMYSNNGSIEVNDDPSQGVYYVNFSIGAFNTQGKANWSDTNGTGRLATIISSTRTTLNGTVNNAVVLGGNLITADTSNTVYTDNARLAEGSGTVVYSAGTDLYSIFATAGAGISGSGTDNTVPLWNGATGLDDSILSQAGTVMTNTGDFIVTGDFTVNGTTTTIDTQTLRTADNNIELNLSGDATSATGGGLTVLSGVSNSTDATWLIDATGNWAANAGIQGTTVTATEFFAMTPYTDSTPASPSNDDAWFHSGATGTITLNYRVGGSTFAVELSL